MMPHSTHHKLFPEAPQHGASIRWILETYPDAPTPIIDLSTGITPYPYPLPPLDEALYHRLPDPSERLAAEQACLKHYGASHAQAVLSSGLQPVLFALAARRQHCRVAIISPTYAEHARVWRAVGHTITEIEMLGQLPHDVDVVILCNPNNPTGTMHSAETLSHYIKKYPQVVWIIDESFADLTPECSMAPMAGLHSNLVVLRSVGKFFGLAGLRASVALCHDSIASWLRVATGPWPVSTPACQWLPILLNDHAWQQQQLVKLRDEAIGWRGILKNYFNIIGHTDLFTLVESGNAYTSMQQLASYGIATRHFAEHPNWLRFGLPSRQYIPRVSQALEISQ